MHGHLLDHVAAERRDLPGDGHGAAGHAQPQPAVGGLAAGVHLALHGHCGQSGDRAQLGYHSRFSVWSTRDPFFMQEAAYLQTDS